MIKAARLPLHFDAEGLKADLAAIDSGEWSSISSEPAAQTQADPEVIARCPHLREVIAAFQCPLKSVRLLKLGAGSSLRQHRENGLGFEIGDVRICVPVVTNPGVEYFLDGRRVVMNEGECWYLDLGLPHRAENRGASDHLHLELDCTLNDWLRTMLLEAGEAPMALNSFERFREMVFADPALQAELRQTPDREQFVALAVRLGGQRGCDFTAGDVDAAWQAARRAQIERWI